MSALERLQERIEKRSEALRGAHLPVPPPSIAAAMCELEDLGTYIHGEPRARTLRRAFVRKWLAASQRGRYSEVIPLPATWDAARRELLTMGPYVLGEPGRVSRRRAAIVRAHPGLGGYLARLELEALGPASESEPTAIANRRRALRARIDRAR